MFESLLSLIPYFVPPEKTFEFGSKLPVIGDHITLQVFGITVAIGVLVGLEKTVKYGKSIDLDEFQLRDQCTWMLIFGFVISHWISVIFYFPEKIQENPLVLLEIWNGLSSVGGFFGAFIGMNFFCWKRKQPVLPYADSNIMGLLVGMCFGRAACAMVHDHPGKQVSADNLLAVGPWPCRCPDEIAEAAGCVANGGRYLPQCCDPGSGIYRYDLGLIEFVFLLGLTAFMYYGFNWRKARPGVITGLVSMIYGTGRFFFDFFRETKVSKGVGVIDVRYAGLTTAQYFSLAFIAVGIWLVFIRKPRDSDKAYSKESDRIAKEQAAKAKADGASSEGVEDKDPAPIEDSKNIDE